jgi:hypothetical protein
LPSSPSTPPASPLLTRRAILGLGLVSVAEALLVCLAVWPGMPWAELLDAEALPAALVGLALGLGLLLAPAWAEDPRARPPSAGQLPPGEVLCRAAFLAGWQAATLGYFLLVAGRMTPLGGPGIFRSLLVVAATLSVAVLLAARIPRAYAGLIFLWAVALPVGCFLLVEVFLSTPAGAVGWRQAAGPTAASLRETVAWLLSLSPGTAAIGTLRGELADGGAAGWKEVAVSAALLLAAVVGSGRRQSGTIQSTQPI